MTPDEAQAEARRIAPCSETCSGYCYACKQRPAIAAALLAVARARDAEIHAAAVKLVEWWSKMLREMLKLTNIEDEPLIIEDEPLIIEANDAD